MVIRHASANWHDAAKPKRFQNDGLTMIGHTFGPYKLVEGSPQCFGMDVLIGETGL